MEELTLNLVCKIKMKGVTRKPPKKKMEHDKKGNE
jgi:hypothetical protein